MNDPKWTINVIINNNNGVPCQSPTQILTFYFALPLIKLKTLDPNLNCNFFPQACPTHHVIETLA